MRHGKQSSRCNAVGKDAPRVASISSVSESLFLFAKADNAEATQSLIWNTARNGLPLFLLHITTKSQLAYPDVVHDGSSRTVIILTQLFISDKHCTCLTPLNLKRVGQQLN
eukprot:gnl/TRDRNA2_/TRDRNA2_140400_c0_seq1.p2 gnl/TRDRNA2_/TRDRNA2_140400_c0~~gnl/TRDRNA2_/TRDRNA2_140400_c0_seq1.p2  ORF type:complete len:111 (+),score=6.70 gnl/TRDRNA2_/TRDRNA2_140400_c0_seq1:123-455(+)